MMVVFKGFQKGDSLLFMHDTIRSAQDDKKGCRITQMKAFEGIWRALLRKAL
ncbi:MAG: hypothetical protein WAO23_03190 [Dethiobacteria bacterium]